MPKFDYDDIVTAISTAPKCTRSGSKAWVVGVLEVPQGKLLSVFPKGVVYTIEFEDGTSIEIEEGHLELFVDSSQ